MKCGTKDAEIRPEAGVKQTGTPSLEELRGTPGFPDEERLKRGPVAVIECVECIPCNPCETACPRKAISIGADITDLPVLDVDICTGCGACVAACPGIAIYVKDFTYEESRVTILFPYEYLPLPKKGDTVDMADRFGRTLCKGEVLMVQTSSRNKQTALIKAAFDKAFAFDAVTIVRLKPAGDDR